jgi:ABC-type bacteriocin/lantibiotic exporter with double-glycine peptidase domain
LDKLLNPSVQLAGVAAKVSAMINPSLRLFLRANSRNLLGMLGASVMVNLFVLAVPLFSLLVYDKAMGNAVHDTLWALSIGMLLLLAQEFAVRLSRVQLVEHAGARWDAFLDERLMRAVLTTPLSRHLPVADLLNKVREVAAARDVLGAQFILPLADVPFLLLYVGIMAVIGGWLVAIPVITGAVLFLVMAGSSRLTQQRHADLRDANRAKMHTLIDVLAARDSLLGQPLATMAETTYRAQSQAAARSGARARWWAQTAQQTIPVLISLSSVAVLVCGVYRVEDQAMSVGGVISVNLISGRMLGVLCSLAPFRARWREFTQALTGLGDTLDLKAAPLQQRAHELQADALMLEGLRLEKVAFKYPGNERAVLDDISVHLRAGEMVALIGSSGSGKSTLLRVLAGQMPPVAGRVTFAGQLIANEADRYWLNHQALCKTQDSNFLGARLRDVVSGGDAGASEESVLIALRAAGLGPALERGDLALNSAVGTNGISLSGGQRQMVALAAAFHTRRSLLLMDEPTLGLDRTAQESVLKALRPLRDGRCLVVATHAAEVIALADRVIVLDKGRIVADATPQQLMPQLAKAPQRVPDAQKRTVGG